MRRHLTLPLYIASQLGGKAASISYTSAMQQILVINDSAGSYTTKLINRLLCLAAFTHDLGKMSVAFQAKLRRAMSGEPGSAEFIRHDALSFLMLKTLCAGALEPLKGLPWLSADELSSKLTQASAQSLQDSFTLHLREDLKLLEQALSPAPSRSASESVSGHSLEALACALVAFLSLTHHRLPGLGKHANRKAYTYLESFSADTYFNPKLSTDYRASITIASNAFLDDHPLGQQLIRAIEDLQQLLAAAPADLNLRHLVQACLLHGRPTLVLGDHLASAMKSHEVVPAEALLANTRPSHSDGLEAFMPGDTLATHIRSVVRHTRKQAQAALNLISNQLDGFPSLSLGGQRNIDAKRSPTGKFAWQHQAYEHLHANYGGLPSFLVVTANTGSGKTILSAQAMRALRSERFTYALGLRSLTLQTGQSYKEDLGLMEADLAVVIGDSVAKKAFDVAQAGSESLDQTDLLVVSKGEDPEWLSSIKDPHKKVTPRQALGSHKIDFVSAPIVVCTVDQLIGVTQLRTVKKALDYRRVQSSDLILDEVDNYSADELKHLASLCFVAGYSRKHVVCLSATMGPIHTEALYEAYQAGIAMNHALTGLGDDIFFATVSNTCPPASLTIKAGDVASVKRHVLAYNEDSIKEQLKFPAKVKDCVLPATARDYSAILGQALVLHASHAGKVGDQRVSAGFIRMNTVKNARRLAKHLYETADLPADTEIAVVCYHSKYSALELSCIDRLLNTLTNRKRLESGQEFSSAARKEIIEPLLAANPGKKNLVLIVVTTSIIETGRDHDYDWAIVEPNSHRSLIQAAGRIRRHREPGAPGCNLAVIQYPDKSLDKVGVPQAVNPINAFSHPGPLTRLREDGKPAANTADGWARTVRRASLALGGTAMPDISRDCSAVGFLAAYPDGVLSAVALEDPARIKNSLAKVEQWVLHDALLSASGAELKRSAYRAVSSRDIIQKSLQLTDWAYQESFRGSDPQDDMRVFLAHRTPGTQDVRLRLEIVNVAGAAANVQRDKVRPHTPSRVLLVVGSASADMTAVLEKELRAYEGKLSASELVSLSSYVPQAWGDSVPECWYNPLLGFNDKPAG